MNNTSKEEQLRECLKELVKAATDSLDSKDNLAARFLLEISIAKAKNILSDAEANPSIISDPEDKHYGISQRTLSVHLKASEAREEKYKTALQDIKDFITKLKI